MQQLEIEEKTTLELKILGAVLVILVGLLKITLLWVFEERACTEISSMLSWVLL